MCEFSNGLIICPRASVTARQTTEWVKARLRLAPHTAGCAALDFDGDYRPAVYPERCNCEARIAVEAGKEPR